MGTLWVKHFNNSHSGNKWRWLTINICEWHTKQYQSKYFLYDTIICLQESRNCYHKNMWCHTIWLSLVWYHILALLMYVIKRQVAVLPFVWLNCYYVIYCINSNLWYSMVASSMLLFVIWCQVFISSNLASSDLVHYFIDAI